MLLWYRGPVIWNFVNKTGQVPESLASFKNTIRKLHADLEAFPFNKETVVITYFWQQHINDRLLHSIRTWRALY